jgi:Asp-tRNA(Asn)/Glu-tRNA(Gln) amidotransferase A subunit family amidase
MSLQSLNDRPARDLAKELRNGGLSATAVTTAFLDRIASREPDLHAWAWIDRDLTLAQAQAADNFKASGAVLGQLHGLPVGVKDIFDTADMPTECGTPVHRGRRPTTDATMVARLRAAGAVILGKTVTTELAVYTPGPTRNPHDLTRTPGGSSSGSAAAVAAGMAPLALATQTNGSVLRPAAFCGVVGYKPSLGLLPRTGILKQSTVLDQPGLMARDIEDVAFLAHALIGPDLTDEQSFGGALPDLIAAASAPVQKPRLAYVRGPYWDRADLATRQALDAFVDTLGADVEAIALPSEFGEAAQIHGLIMHAGIAEAFRNEYAHGKALLSERLIGMIELGSRISAVSFIEALSARDRLRHRLAAIAAPFDALITPATVGVAPKLEHGSGDPIMATLWTLVGAPSLNLPLLSGEEGMPLGVQLVGGPLGDQRLIQAAAWLERASKEG